MIELLDIKARLTMLGYDPTDDDLLTYIATSTENQMLGTCNLSSVPADLMKVAIDLVCAEYLRTLKNSGQSTAVNIDPAVRAISEGDTKVDFTVGSGSKTPEQRFDELVAMLESGKERLVEVRRLKW